MTISVFTTEHGVVVFQGQCKDDVQEITRELLKTHKPQNIVFSKKSNLLKLQVEKLEVGL